MEYGYIRVIRDSDLLKEIKTGMSKVLDAATMREGHKERAIERDRQTMTERQANT